MKNLIIAVTLALSSTAVFAGDVHVGGYQTQNGTYVQDYHRSSPNNTTYDNYGTKGNSNPYTGAAGTRNPSDGGYGGSSSGSTYGSGSGASHRGNNGNGLYWNQ